MSNITHLPTPDLPRIPVRALLRFTTEELWRNLEGDFIVVFDDGEVVTHHKETLYSSYAWDYLRAYPETPMLVRHHIAGILKGKRLGAKSHLDLLNSILWSVYDAYRNQSPDRRALIDKLSHMSYQITNAMYNDLSYRLEAYVTSLDILDFTAFTTHPDVREAYRTMEPTEEGIAKVNSVIKELIYDRPDLEDNALTKTLRSGLARANQALQCLGPRGFLTDIDSNLFLTPVRRGFVQGIRNMYESMVESRTAATSLIYSTEPLQQSEYFSRRQQLICQNVRNLHLTDCGSTDYLIWPVRDARYEGVHLVAECDLKTIYGKYYMDDDHILKIVKPTDTHLIGKSIRMRSVVGGCHHPDPYGVCEICFGQTSESIPANTNLGHACCVSMTSDLGQLILSTKHFIGSSVIEGIVLRGVEKRWLAADINGNDYRLNEVLKNKHVKMLVAANRATGLTDLTMTENLGNLSITRISEMESFILIVNDGKREDIIPLTVGVQGRLPSLSHAMLAHIKRTGWSVVKGRDKEGLYAFDMSGWDFSQPILTLPMRHYSMSNHQSQIAALLESTVSELESRSTTMHPGSMLIDFHDLVNRRLSINLATLEIILYSSMIVSAKDNDYSLPKPWTASGVGVMRKIFQARSLSATMGFQNHVNTFISPASYVHTNRPDHIMDGVILPQEVLLTPQR